MAAEFPAGLPTQIPSQIPTQIPADSSQVADSCLGRVPIARTAKMLLREGIAAARQRDRRRAIALFTQSLALQSDDPTIQLKGFYYRGCARSGVGQYKGAIADFSQVIQFSQSDGSTLCAVVPAAKLTEIYIHRGNAYRHLGHYSLAVADHTSGVERSGGSAQSYGARGLLRLDMDEYDGAISDFTCALSVHPTFAQCHMWRGFAQLSSGAYQQAADDLSRAIEAIPACAEAYNHRGVAYFYLNEFAAASADFDQAIRLNPKFAEGYHNRGNLRQLRGELAAADYGRASLLDPRLSGQKATLSSNNAAFYRHRALAQLNQGHFPEAVADYTRALAIFPNAYTYYHRGSAYLALNELKRAHSDFDAAIAHSPDYGAVYGDRARLRFEGGDFVGAIADADQALALMASLMASDAQPLKDIYTTRCLACFCLRKPAQALQSFEQLIRSIAICAAQSSSHTSKDSTSIGSV